MQKAMTITSFLYLQALRHLSEEHLPTRDFSHRQPTKMLPNLTGAIFRFSILSPKNFQNCAGFVVYSSLMLLILFIVLKTCVKL
jgi:hypothetical protein